MIHRLRLATGLILLTYLVMHFLNHALGLVSLDLMEQSRPAFQWFWGSPVGLVLLYGALLIHAGLAFYALYRRRRFSTMHVGEAVQLIFGLCVLPLLVVHVLGTRMAEILYGIEPTYPWILLVFWQGDVWLGVRQVAVLLVAWSHACCGIYYWQRLKPYWPRWRYILFGAGLMLPLLALLGMYSATKEVLTLFNNPAWLSDMVAEVGRAPAGAVERMKAWEVNLLLAYAGLVAVVLVLRRLRPILERRRGAIRVLYDDGEAAEIAVGSSFLDISRTIGHPHASVCGGRGRCSTCRIRVRHGQELLPPPSEQEKTVLTRIAAAPEVRLACQCRPPAGRYEISPLLPAHATAKDGFGRADFHQGQELEIAVLFADLRDFTRLSENRLPFDLVFLLNRYFDAMGKAVEDAGGHLDKFIGDGVMALFGIRRGPNRGARAALLAAKRMGERIQDLNHGLASDLERPLRIGIGIHFGPAIVGDMGYGQATQLTAVGDTVNAASRIEALSKGYEAQVVISEPVAEAAGVDLSAYPSDEVTLRGRATPVRLFIVKDAATLPIDVPETAARQTDAVAAQPPA